MITKTELEELIREHGLAPYVYIKSEKEQFKIKLMSHANYSKWRENPHQTALLTIAKDTNHKNIIKKLNQAKRMIDQERLRVYDGLTDIYKLILEKRRPVTPVGRYLIDKIKPLHQKRIALRKELESAETELERDLGNRIELELFHQETELMIKGSQYGIQGESLNDYRVSTPVNCIWTDKHSVVTSSGIGDGSYDCYVAKNEAGQIIGIKIDYYLEDNEDL